MLNWIKFITAFLFALALVIVVAVFYNANKPLASATEAAADAAIKSGEVVTVNSVQPYNGTKSYMTVFGVNNDGEEIAVLVDENSLDAYKTVQLADGITAGQAVATVEEELTVQKVLHVSLGIEDEELVWEVTFMNDINKLNYVYVSFENGQWWKRILNL